MNLSVLQLFGAEGTKVIKKQLYTNNMSCKQKKDYCSRILFYSALIRILFQIVVNSFGPRFVFEWKDITLFRPFIPFSL